MISDCDDEEVLKKSRHERKIKIVDSTEDSDAESQDNKRRSKTKFSYNLKMPSTLLSLMNATPNVLDNKENKTVTANNGINILSSW